MALLDDAEKLGGDILAGKAPPTKRTKWDDMEDQGNAVLEATAPPAAAPPVAAPPRWTEDNPLYATGDPREALPPSTVNLGGIVGAMDEGWRKPDPLMTPEQEEQQTRLWGPYLGGGVNLFYRGTDALLNRVPNALMYGGAELANQITGDPRAGRDVTALLPLLPMAHIGTGVPPAETPAAPRPAFVSERAAPPPVEGQSTLGRANALIRHDEQWSNPGAPGYLPPGADPKAETRFLPPADAPPTPPPDFVPPGRGGPRVGGTPPGVIPNGLTPEQLAEHENIPEALPPMRGEIRTQADAEARADQIVRHFASIGNKEPIPGAEGALPTLTKNAGLATLYRAVRDKDTPIPFTQLEDAAKAATKAKLDAMAGTEPDLKAAVVNREKTTEPLYKQAWANKTEADPSGAIKTIEDLMASPVKQNDTAMAELTKIHKKLQGQTDPEQLKGITDSIDATIQQLNTEGKADRGTRRALARVDEAITGAISPAAPGFDAAQATWANLSRRIDEMKYFQSRKLTDLQGNPTLGNIRSTLDDIAKKQAGDKFHPADSVTPENLGILKQMHDQTQRESFTASAGKSLGGSNTFQNLATDSVMRSVGKQIGANILGTGGGYLTDLASGGGGVTGAVIGNLTGNALQGVATVRAAQAAARQTAGEQMLMRALRERLLNVNNKGVEALRAP